MSRLYIIGGEPGAGKSTFATELAHQLPNAKYLALDSVKEFLFDLVGFEDLTYKAKLVDFSYELFYQCTRFCIDNGYDLIVDYPFSSKQISFFRQVAKEHDLTVYTFVLYGDRQTLYKRIINREGKTRHKGHMAHSYLPTMEQTSNQRLSYEQFSAKCESSKYVEFEFGTTIKIDTTTFSLANYESCVQELIAKIANDENNVRISDT